MSTKIILKRFGIDEAIGNRMCRFRNQWKDWIMLKRQADHRIGHACVNDALNGFPQRIQIECRMQTEQRLLDPRISFSFRSSQDTLSAPPFLVSPQRVAITRSN